MKNAQSLIEGLLGGLANRGGQGAGGGLAGTLGGLLGGTRRAEKVGMPQAGGVSGPVGAGLGGAGDVLSRAKGAWDGQSGLAKGAIAGGVLALLMGSKGARKLAGGAMKAGGAAVIGSLALQAFRDWQAGKAPAIGREASPPALPSPAGTPFQPEDPAEADDFATHTLQAMVAAAKADGTVTEEGAFRIRQAIGQLGLGEEAETLLAAELDAPLDAGRIAALAATPEEAAALYAASLLVVDAEAPAEKGYLALLAARLKLAPDLVAHLHSRAAALAG